MDLSSPFPSGESVLVVIGVYSWFPEVDILKSTTTPSIINKLDGMFSTHRFPAHNLPVMKWQTIFPNVVLSTTMLHYYGLKQMVWLSPS